MRQWRRLSASHLSQCSKTWQVQTILVFTWLSATLKGRSGVKKTEISSTESKRGGCGRRNHSWCGSCSQSHAINDTHSSCSSVRDGFSWHEDMKQQHPMVWPATQALLLFSTDGRLHTRNTVFEGFLEYKYIIIFSSPEKSNYLLKKR